MKDVRPLISYMDPDDAKADIYHEIEEAGIYILQLVKVFYNELEIDTKTTVLGCFEVNE